MINLSSYDQDFIDELMFLFDMGESMNQIATKMKCDVNTVDQIICETISCNTLEIL
jgi:hypothetical protein